MPYITKELRDIVDPVLAELQFVIHRGFESDELDGVLNYVVSNIVAAGVKPKAGPWRYSQIAQAMAVFECAKAEFYRRVAGPKEDQAIEANGDIPPYSKESLVNTNGSLG